MIKTFINRFWFVISRIFVGFVFLFLTTLVIYFFVLFPFILSYLLLFGVAFVCGFVILQRN